MNRKILAFLTAAMCFAGAVPFNAVAENSVKGLNGLQEAGGSLISGEQSDEVYEGYYSKLSDISATAEADTAKLMIDKNYASDTVSSSCTVKSLGKDLTIYAGDKDIIVLLDEAVLEKTITVKADKGSVTFFIQGSLTCGKESRGIVWHEICDGCKVTDDKYIPVTFYGSEDSAVTLTDEAILCGSLRLPYTVLDDRSTGAFKIEYVSESDNKHYMMKPTVIGNALLKKLVNSEVVFAYCAKKADSGELNGLTISKGTKQLTLSEVIPLAKKGDKITWSDFEPYAGDWHGIGMYTHVCNYDLGGGFFLLVEGNPPEEPAVVELYKDGYENRIDIRKDDIDEFMAWASDFYHASELDTAEKKMTLDDVISLSKKGNALDWEDFVIYSGQESGHGYTEWRFELEDGYTLRVMGESKEKAPEKITLYRNDQRKGLEEIDIRTDDVKAFLESKQYYFNEIGSMTKNELKALFAKKGLTEDKGYGVWTKEEAAAVLKDNTFTVCLKPDARFVTKDGTEVLNEASSVAELLKYDDYNTVQANHLDNAAKLPRDEIFLLFSHAEIRTEKNEKGEYVYRRYFHYNFGSMYSDEETQIKKLTTALNYLQLNPYLDGFNLNTNTAYGGTTDSEIKGDTNCDGEVDMSDVVLVMQALANPNKYGLNGTAEHHLTAQGKLNGDMDGDGLTVGDAQAIQKKLLGLDDKNSGELPQFSDIVSIKTPYRPAMSDWSGIGILLEFDSKDYPITLSTDKGHFTTWDIETGDGVVTNVGKTYDIGNNGYIFWTPDDLKYSDDYENEITVNGKNGDAQIELGKIYVTKADNGDLTASPEKPDSSKNADRSALAGKKFVYEKEGFGGDCYIDFKEDGMFLYSPGYLSSYLGGGTWEISGNKVILTQENDGMSEKRVNYFSIVGNELIFIEEGSDNFIGTIVKDGEKFYVKQSAT
ncbi:dockerin type I repeat-containing protein [Ruminococcus flavefaciens]|uniref:dockerin type I repeat-containing protein n=1 Tax=Ruminococcus flavefaciens TaxID=1265 RepID=UPI00048A5B45|nr:dockerin type I repeat-containing protein [Ruminococcus flavefaciens]